MISCPFKDLKVVNEKLEKILQTIKPADPPLLKQVKEETILSMIILNVQKLLEELVSAKPLFTNSLELESDMYEQIEHDLQKQQHLNRLMIRKQLEFKQYQKALEEELRTEKVNARKMKSRLDKYNDKIVNKDLQLVHLNNQKKVLGRDKKSKEFITMDSPFADFRQGSGLKGPNKELFSEQRLTHRRRRSDDVYKKPSTGAPKRKVSVPKK